MGRAVANLLPCVVVCGRVWSLVPIWVSGRARGLSDCVVMTNRTFDIRCESSTSVSMSSHAIEMAASRNESTEMAKAANTCLLLWDRLVACVHLLVPPKALLCRLTGCV